MLLTFTAKNFLGTMTTMISQAGLNNRCSTFEKRLTELSNDYVDIQAKDKSHD